MKDVNEDESMASRSFLPERTSQLVATCDQSMVVEGQRVAVERTSAHRFALRGKSSPAGRTYLIIAILLVTITTANAQQTVLEREAARVETLRRITPSIVCVMDPKGQGGGSGVLISADGYAISNYHVTSGAGSFMKCGLSDGKLYDAVIVGIDPTGDIALIQLQGRTDFAFATPGDSDQVQVGQEVMALGNPFLLASDFTPTVTYGIVSGVHRYQYPANTFLEYTDCIQIDASINPGNSGGPSFDIKGRWIGINGRASFEKRGRVNSGAAYAISVNQIRKFIGDLMCGLIVDHGIAEFTVKTSDTGEVRAAQVSALSEAYRRGLRPGDEVLSFAGRLLTSANDFQNVLGIFPEGTRLPLTWRNRDGLHEATIRLRPLHAFQKAPPLPEERQPKPQQDPDHQDGEELKTDGKDAEVPESLKSLFVARDGFCNFHFNELQRLRLVNTLKERVATNGDSRPAWVIVFSGAEPGPKLAGELTIAASAVGMTLNNRPFLQNATDPQVTEESPQLPGFLIAMNQLRRLLSGNAAAFTEQQAAGRTYHLPLKRDVDVLLTRDSVRACRWYFDESSALPVGVDVEYAQGTDEARLLFTDWADRSGAVFPSRIGVISGVQEDLRWLNIDSVTVNQVPVSEEKKP
ncbi:MAG: trypsin-like peptidase domain-containing protein [Planctomycetota bacterium]|nr:trypsin-like peptidase domain-containing protein [Planctomycetota bacterium]